ncbi:MAG: gliding motility-associated C-terminal domain-containing protein [Saprospiraceae bacterium]|nr:gliding motility-associated C-terminal domain-containing protein [Candidatus Opimibacter iunctus]
MCRRIIVPGCYFQDATYVWQDQSTDPILQVSEAGTYAVVVNLQGCIMNDTVTIDYSLPVTFDLGPDRTICDGDLLVLDPGLNSPLEYLWQDQSTEGTYVVQSAGDYWLQVKDACSTAADTITVAVDQCQCRLYFPNVFSPNGDLVNDEALPVATCEMTYCRLKIFDRFGDQVFESQDAIAGWDGTSRSRPAQSGVYAYVLIYAYKDGIPRMMTGDITLLR